MSDPVSSSDRSKRKLVQGLVDQLASSLSNAIVPLSAAGAMSVRSFAEFSLLWSVVVFLIAVNRGITCLPLSAQGVTAERLLTQLSTSYFLCVAQAFLGCAALSIVWGFFTELPVRLLVLLCCSLPCLLVQDLLRHFGVAIGRAPRVLVADASWVVIALIGALFHWWAHSLTVLVAFWALGASLSAWFLLLALPVPPRAGVRRSIASLSGRSSLAVGALSTTFSVPVSFMVMAAAGREDVLSTMSAGGLLMAPINVGAASINLVLLNRLAQARNVGERYSLLRPAMGLGAAALVWTFLLVAVPSPLAEAMPGSAWGLVYSVLPILGVQYAVGSLALAAVSTLAGVGADSHYRAVSLSVGLIRLAVVTLLVASVAPVSGFIIGEALVNCCLLTMSITQGTRYRMQGQ